MFFFSIRNSYCLCIQWQGAWSKCSIQDAWSDTHNSFPKCLKHTSIKKKYHQWLFIQVDQSAVVYTDNECELLPCVRCSNWVCTLPHSGALFRKGATKTSEWRTNRYPRRRCIKCLPFQIVLLVHTKIDCIPLLDWHLHSNRDEQFTLSRTIRPLFSYMLHCRQQTVPGFFPSSYAVDDATLAA